MIENPDVSVVLSVRNGGTDLPSAIDSILTQTYSGFELIVINNGSTDGTAQFLEGIADPRVRVYHQADMGLAAALNRGISLARGRYIARQDHDDLALPTRIEKQVRFLDQNPEFALVGTRAEIWIGDAPTGRFLDHPADDAVLRFELLFDSQFVHSSVMLRKSALEVVGLYSIDPARQPPEDYELWSRIARRFRVANLPERLTIYREVPGSMSRASAHPFREKLVLICAENLATASGYSAPADVHVEMAALVHGLPDTKRSRSGVRLMYDVIDRAARNISGGGNIPDLDDRVRQRKANFRYHVAQRSGFRRARALARRLKGGLGRLGLLGASEVRK